MKLQTLALFAMAATAVGGVAWVFIYPLLSGERQAEKRRDRGDGRQPRGAGCRSLAVQQLQDSAHAKSGEASHRRRTGGNVDVLEWARDPWGHSVPIHIAWFLIQVAFVSAVAFLIVHAAYVRFFAGEKQWSGTTAPEVVAAIPERVPRHSPVARAFHWLMAASMLTLLFTAFLPKVGVEFDWVAPHWIAGTVLAASVVFHIIHASFWLDFWAIWPDKTDIVDATRRLRRFVGQAVPAPRRFAKYPLENKGFHGAIIAAGLSVIATGVLYSPYGICA